MTYLVYTSSPARTSVRLAADKPELPEAPLPKPGVATPDGSRPGWPEPGTNWMPVQKSNAPRWLTDEASRRWRRSRFPKGR